MRVLRYVGVGLVAGVTLGFLAALLRPRDPSDYAQAYGEDTVVDLRREVARR